MVEEIVETCRQWKCPLRVQGVEIGHNEVIMRYDTFVATRGYSKWSENWEHISSERDGDDRTWSVETTTLHLAKHPGYIEYGNEYVEIFVPPHAKLSLVDALRADGHTIRS